MWQTKRAEELELAARDMEEVFHFVNIIININIINNIINHTFLKVKEMSRIKMFGRPGNGAPTGGTIIMIVFIHDYYHDRHDRLHDHHNH